MLRMACGGKDRKTKSRKSSDRRLTLNLTRRIYFGSFLLLHIESSSAFKAPLALLARLPAPQMLRLAHPTHKIPCQHGITCYLRSGYREREKGEKRGLSLPLSPSPLLPSPRRIKAASVRPNAGQSTSGSEPRTCRSHRPRHELPIQRYAVNSSRSHRILRR